jgi:hypothetical protein
MIIHFRHLAPFQLTIAIMVRVVRCEQILLLSRAIYLVHARCVCHAAEVTLVVVQLEHAASICQVLVLRHSYPIREVGVPCGLNANLAVALPDPVL